MSLAGTELPPLTVTFKRDDLVRYAGASGDFNSIHWSDRMAAALGLPGVIAHGMLTMASAVRVVTDWLDDPADLVEYGVRFTNMIPVPDDDQGATSRIDGEEIFSSDAWVGHWGPRKCDEQKANSPAISRLSGQLVAVPTPPAHG